MNWLLIICSVAIIGKAISLDIPIPFPPPEDVDSEWHLIPDDEGGMHLVNVISTQNEAVPFFNVEIGVIFELYTRQNPRYPQRIQVDNVASLAESYFNASHPTRFVIHGYNSKGDLTNRFQTGYFDNSDRDTNFIAVNWQAGSNTINYINARRRVNQVGPFVAKCIDFLVTFGHMNLEDVIVIGHSLGAHISGIAGKHVTAGQLPKIIGLDPAYPLFNYNDVAGRLAIGDARTVETIQTNAGFLGYSSPLGDASFYPNGGRAQPGCGLDMTGACAHSRSHEFYVESINSDVGFYAYPCRSFEEVRRGNCHVVGEQSRMGGDPGNQGSAQGIYYLETNRSPPFARG